MVRLRAESWVVISAAQLYLSFDNDQEAVWPPRSSSANSWQDPGSCQHQRSSDTAKEPWDRSWSGAVRRWLWNRDLHSHPDAFACCVSDLNETFNDTGLICCIYWSWAGRCRLTQPQILQEMSNNCKERLIVNRSAVKCSICAPAQCSG